MAKMLVVDDSETVRSELAQFLEHEGHEVHTASDGEEGLRVVQDIESFDLMFIDVNMPIMDGIVMVEKIRQLDAHTHTPIFMLTSDSDKALISRAKKSGVVAWMIKPCQAIHIKRAIDKVLSRQTLT